MKERHDCQQAITLCEVQPFTNLSRIRDEVAVREQATLGFSRGAGCVNYDRIGGYGFLKVSEARALARASSDGCPP